jgi:DNA mismatch repair protein MutL
VLFKLTQEGRVGFQSSGSGKSRETLAAVFGVDTARQMIALPSTPDAPVKVDGYISPLSVHRGSRRGMTFFINGRYVQDASLSAAVTQAYHGLLMVGRYPLAVIFLDIPPEDVDVNVHPAKAEIRFRNPDIVFSVVQRVVRATLLDQTPPPAIDLQRSWGQADRSRTISSDWVLAAADIEKAATIRGVQPALPAGDLPLLRAVGQVGAAYLVAEGPDGLYLIDQHAAHERVLFEALMQAGSQGKIESQTLLEPITIEFTPTQAAILEEYLEVMKRLGFEIEPFGQRTYRLRSLPDLLTDIAPEQALRSVVEDFEEDESPLMSETEARLAARVCKRAAVKAGQVLSLVEQQRLLRDLEKCQSPRTCPHGRPTMVHLSVEALERQFGRRG